MHLTGAGPLNRGFLFFSKKRPVTTFLSQLASKNIEYGIEGPIDHFFQKSDRFLAVSLSPKNGVILPFFAIFEVVPGPRKIVPLKAFLQYLNLECVKCLPDILLRQYETIWVCWSGPSSASLKGNYGIQQQCRKIKPMEASLQPLLLKCIKRLPYIIWNQYKTICVCWNGLSSASLILLKANSF